MIYINSKKMCSYYVQPEIGTVMDSLSICIPIKCPNCKSIQICIFIGCLSCNNTSKVYSPVQNIEPICNFIKDPADSCHTLQESQKKSEPEIVSKNQEEFISKSDHKETKPLRKKKSSRTPIFLGDEKQSEEKKTIDLRTLCGSERFFKPRHREKSMKQVSNSNLSKTSHSNKIHTTSVQNVSINANRPNTVDDLGSKDIRNSNHKFDSTKIKDHDVKTIFMKIQLSINEVAQKVAENRISSQKISSTSTLKQEHVKQKNKKSDTDDFQKPSNFTEIGSDKLSNEVFQMLNIKSQENIRDPKKEPVTELFNKCQKTRSFNKDTSKLDMETLMKNYKVCMCCDCGNKKNKPNLEKNT